MTPFQCGSCLQGGATLSHLRQVIDFIEDIFSGSWRFNPVCRIVTLIEAPVRMSIAFGKAASFGVASAVVACSTWVTRFVRPRESSRWSDRLGEENHSETEADLFDEGVEITVRIEHRAFDILRRPGCVVTVQFSKEGTRRVKRTPGKVSDSSEPRYKVQDHKLPFWVR